MNANDRLAAEVRRSMREADRRRRRGERTARRRTQQASWAELKQFDGPDAHRRRTDAQRHAREQLAAGAAGTLRERKRLRRIVCNGTGY